MGEQFLQKERNLLIFSRFQFVGAERKALSPIIQYDSKMYLNYSDTKVFRKIIVL